MNRDFTPRAPVQPAASNPNDLLNRKPSTRTCDTLLSMTTGNERQVAAARVADLIAVLKKEPGPEIPRIVEECEALSRAVDAFHMEGIRFRIYNVDRLLSQHAATLPAEVRSILEDARRHLEAAGFHTRSHQSPV